jgi:cation diffusion facilitator family transporter
MAEESKGTVLLAGAANLSIAIAKLVGGLVSGSAAMMAEAAHSVADTLNQAFLLTALERSEKPADRQHQFGYGKERYFWSLLAAVGIFVLGAGFSVFEGIRAILEPEELTSLLITYAVLAAAFVFEGVSWLKALRQLKAEARERSVSMKEHFETTPDPTVKTVAFEDTAALVGVLIAAAGVTLHVLTDQGFWDGAASVLIGLLLIGVAYSLGKENKAFLVGVALPPDVQTQVRGEIEKSAGVVKVLELMSMRLAPDEVLVAARVDMVDSKSGGDIERFSDEVDERIRERFPEIRHVFIDPTPQD